MIFRLEEEKDEDAVYEINSAAFETCVEADLVDRLRDFDGPFVSLVAENEGVVVGHIIFTPVSIDEEPKERVVLPEDVDAVIYGLGPMSIAPHMQKQGIGTGLLRAGLEQCIDLDIDAVVVLGHPEFYRRCGFKAASNFGLKYGADIPQENFMAIELVEESLRNTRGVIHYNPEFSEM
jgi:putative acetyltransferase